MLKLSEDQKSVGCPSGQREQTVNLPANAYEGSNPSPTIDRWLNGRTSGAPANAASGSDPGAVSRAWNAGAAQRRCGIVGAREQFSRGSSSVGRAQAFQA